jgi:ribosomal protein S18 acetylase RimI-like enzyme
MPSIRRLAESDAEAFRGIRLAALESAPDAFAAPPGLEAKQPLAHFVAMLRNAIVLAVEHDGALVAVARLTPGKPPKEAHKATINGFFVRPEHRGSGLARALMAAVISDAQVKYEQLTLAVGADNPAAIGLYSSLGFTEYGREPRARKSAGVYQDLILMWRPLTPSQESPDSLSPGSRPQPS